MQKVELLVELTYKNKGPHLRKPLSLLNRGDVIRTRDFYVPNIAANFLSYPFLCRFRLF